MRTTRTCTAAVLAAALTGSGCGASSTHTASSPSTSQASSAAPAAGHAPAAGTTTVSIANYAYGPATLTVKSGTKVTFVNHDATAHTATASGTPGFDTGTLKAGGGSATVTLVKPGTYSYICQFHPFMKGTITVTG